VIQKGVSYRKICFDVSENFALVSWSKKDTSHYFHWEK